MIFPFKICDPIHGFIRFDEIERKVIDSRPFQRLRYIHQMGVAYLLYPGATHCRFGHSLGVMELATRIFDTITHPQNLFSNNVLPDDPEQLAYYRRIVRLAALCHDLGHLPFSHTAEKSLLPGGGHESKTLDIIKSASMQEIWNEFPDSKKVMEDVIKLVVHEKELRELEKGLTLSSFEKILSQVITEDNFGADRIDYLLRDAYFTGVGYGHFDFRQLIDTLRILPACESDGQLKESCLTIGIAESGMQSVESLWIARYLMYARVYHHPKALIYSKHLARFMMKYYTASGFPKDVEGYLRQTDSTILEAMAQSQDEDAAILLQHKPCYQEVVLKRDFPYSLLGPLEKVFDGQIFIDKIYELIEKQGQEKGRHFSVVNRQGNIVPSLAESSFLSAIPQGGQPLRIYADRQIHDVVKQWILTPDCVLIRG